MFHRDVNRLIPHLSLICHTKLYDLIDYTVYRELNQFDHIVTYSDFHLQNSIDSTSCVVPCAFYIDATSASRCSL